MTQAHKALWARGKDKAKMDIKIIQLGFTTSPSFFAELVKVPNKDLKEVLKTATGL